MNAERVHPDDRAEAMERAEDPVMTALRRGAGGRRDDIALLALGVGQR